MEIWASAASVASACNSISRAELQGCATLPPLAPKGRRGFSHLFSVIVVGDEAVYDEWVKKTNAYTVGLKVRRIARVLDPSLAE